VVKPCSFRSYARRQALMAMIALAALVSACSDSQTPGQPAPPAPAPTATLAEKLAPAQIESEKVVPKFFGVYAKMKDGTLVEIRPMDTEYQDFEGDLGGGECLKSLPQAKLRLPEVEGFYIHGHYMVDSFFLERCAEYRGRDGAWDPVFYRTKRGWSKDKFHYVQEAPNLYWLQPRPDFRKTFDEMTYPALMIRLSTLEPVFERDTLSCPFLVKRTEAQQAYADAIAYERANDLEKAFQEFMKAAQLDDALAQFRVGLYYSKGYHVAQDEREAIKWYEKAAEQGSASADCNLACILAGSANATLHNAPKALEHAKRAIEADASSWVYWDALACALARNGQFKDAVDAALKAKALLSEEDTPLKDEKNARLLFRLSLYEKGLTCDRGLVDEFEARRGAMSKDHGAVISDLRTICGAQVAYASVNSSYATKFAALTQARPPFLDGAWDQPRNGYVFLLGGSADNFVVTAGPAQADAGGALSFYVDASGVIRYAAEGVAGPKSPPIGDDLWSAAEEHRKSSKGGLVGSERIVTADVLNVRARPSTDAQIIEKLQEGDTVMRFGRSGDWVLIETPSKKSGWVHGDYISQ